MKLSAKEICETNDQILIYKTFDFRETLQKRESPCSMSYWKNVITIVCILSCFLNALIGVYDMVIIKKPHIPVLPREVQQNTRPNQRSQSGYLRLRHYQRIARQEINRRRFIKIINEMTETTGSYSYRSSRRTVECPMEENKLGRPMLYIFLCFRKACIIFINI